MAKIKISDIVGKTISELIPYHDGATIILSNGKEFDLGIDPDEIQDPKHPKAVKKIFNLEDKLYDITHGNGNKKKASEYKKKLTELKDSLIGKRFHYNNNPCVVRKVISTKDENKVLIEVKTKEKTWITQRNNFGHVSDLGGVKKDKIIKEIYLYSLEK